MCAPERNSTQQAGGDVVYLTGSTGFIGRMILKLCDADDSITKVYCPIRDKKGLTGEERFKQEGLNEFEKTSFVAMSENLPSDVTLVILNAYEVKFYNPVDQILMRNVEPMLRILDECENFGPRIRGICVVSTAYVQNPLPYQRPKMNRIPFTLREHTSAYKLYKDLVGGIISWDEVLEKYAEHLSDHHKVNCYAFSKHVMEHVIHERYHSLPICIARPSIVAPTRDGTYGHGTKTGFPLFMEVARSPILRFPRNEGKLNLVFVEDVAKDIIRAAASLAKPGTDNTLTGEYFHPIYSATTTSELSSIPMFLLGAPNVKRFEIRSEWLRTCLRFVEKSTVALVKGKRKAKLLDLVYKNFDPIMCNNWDFEETYPPTASDIENCARSFYKHGGESSEKKTYSVLSSWIPVLVFGALVFLAYQKQLINPIQQTVLFFILYRMNALTFMQTLFYGDSPVRKLLPATIYPKEYGHGQLEREENIWPSVIASGLEMHLVFMIGLLPDPTTMQWFSWRSVGIMLATHALPVELIYYWGHRWMHDFPSLYKVHKHHHLSTVATPKTSVTFLWSEHLFYDLLFALPILVPTFMGEASLAVTLFYIPVFDVINSLGHTNLELFPSWYLESPLYYLFYCPTYHHVHHKYFKYNYALFMPIYDVIFGTYSKKFTEQDFRAAKKRLHSR